MNELRLILLVLGVLIILGLYLRERLRVRKPDPVFDLNEEETAGQFDAGLKISAGGGREEDHASLLSALRRNPAADDDITEVNVSLQGGESAAGPASIISLHVMADTGTAFRGPALLEILEQLGLVYGDMRIFHHYGIGDMKAERPLFHLANMVEPGSFEPDRMQELTTPGVSLFMQLPTPLDASVVFELMYNTACRLAEELGGRVVSHDREPLSGEKLEALRTRLQRKD
jgi:cell division protein ZipA